MRKYLIAGLTLVVALGLTAVAFAVQKQTADIKFKQKKTNSPTAIDSTFKVSDPDNHTPGEEGKPTRQISRVDIVFPRGTKFDSAYNLRGKPECTQGLADAIVKLCKKSKLATGTTAVDGRNGPLASIIHAKLLAYNAHNGLKIIVSAPGTLADKQVLAPSLKKNKLITDLTATPLAKVNAYLADFHLLIPSLKHKSGKGKKAKTKYYATTPKTCPKSKKWVIKVKYYFLGGGTFTTPGTKNKCTPPKKHKKHKKHNVGAAGGGAS